MIVTTKAIVLSAIKYSDTSLIVKCFTESNGIKSYLLKGVLTSKKGKLKTAYFQPLMQLEIVASHRDKGTLESIREVKVSYHYQTVHNNIYKNALTIFIAEILSNSLQEEERNASLFFYLESSLQWLDNHNEIANFHISFLLTLTRYLGFFPDKENIDALYFDLQEGVFINMPQFNPSLSEEDTIFFKLFLGTIFDEVSEIKMNHKQRQSLLNGVILYFELHLQGFKKPKSLQVLNEVFH